MKRLLFTFCASLFYVIAQSQNVGIGTKTPESTLDVRGNHRMGGLSSYITFDSAAGKIEWHNANLYVPVSQFLLKHSAAGDGLYYNNTAPVSGQLEYRNATGEPVFFTNFTNGNGYFSGNLGVGISSPGAKLHVGNGMVRIEGPAVGGSSALSIGGLGDIQVDANGIAAGRFVIKESGNVGIKNPSPGFPLNFASSLGDKISLWGNSGPHYGFGIQSGLLQIHTDGPTADIAFGYGSSNSFTEQLRIKGNGVLQFPPALAKKIILYPGGSGDAGFAVFGNELRIASDYNGADISFGYDNRSAGFTEKFRMRASGAFSVNGNEGQAGQVLQSNGSGTAPVWSNKPSVLFFNVSSIVTLEGTNISVDIPNINGQSFTLTQAAAVTIQFTIPLAGVNGPFGGGSDGIVGIQLLDGSSNVVVNASSMFSIGNFHDSQIIVIGGGNLNAGTYTIRARLARQNSSAGNTGSDAGTIAGIPIQRGQLIIQIFPN